MQKTLDSKQETPVRWRWLLVVTLACSAACAQGIQLGGLGQPDAARRSHVSLLSDSAEVEAGKPQAVEIVFRVEPGFHINSHTPKDELLIPTVFKPDAGAVKVLGQTYPAGSAFRLKIGAGETLDVYQGDFRVEIRIMAPKGASTLTGLLRYQACDNEACFPARTLTVKVAVSGR